MSKVTMQKRKLRGEQDEDAGAAAPVSQHSVKNSKDTFSRSSSGQSNSFVRETGNNSGGTGGSSSSSRIQQNSKPASQQKHDGSRLRLAARHGLGENKTKEDDTNLGASSSATSTSSPQEVVPASSISTSSASGAKIPVGSNRAAGQSSQLFGAPDPLPRKEERSALFHSRVAEEDARLRDGKEKLYNNVYEDITLKNF